MKIKENVISLLNKKKSMFICCTICYTMKKRSIFEA